MAGMKALKSIARPLAAFSLDKVADTELESAWQISHTNSPAIVLPLVTRAVMAPTHIATNAGPAWIENKIESTSGISTPPRDTSHVTVDDKWLGSPISTSSTSSPIPGAFSNPRFQRDHTVAVQTEQNGGEGHAKPIAGAKLDVVGISIATSPKDPNL